MIGETIGHFHIVQRLGEGGMGTVYRAIDTELEREVALKVLRADVSELPDATRRFRAEAIALARLTHPHIATLFGLVRHGKQWCMVMEYAKGDTLAQVMQASSGLGVERAVRLASQILDGLGYAHAAGVVHRDIKPSNVVVSGADTVKILDFGIARVLHEDRITRQGFVLGTPQYMAPEQIRGADLDGRADVYAVGVLLYEMLARRLPYKADNELALMYAHLEGEATPLADAVPGAPAWLGSLVARALAKRPEDRFPDAATFRAALERRGAAVLVTDGAHVAAPAPEPAQALRPSVGSRMSSGIARLRAWFVPRFTWEYFAGPDGLMTVRRALRVPSADAAIAVRDADPVTGTLASIEPVSDVPSAMTRVRWVMMGAAAGAVLFAAVVLARWMLPPAPAPSVQEDTAAAVPAPNPPAAPAEPASGTPPPAPVEAEPIAEPPLPVAAPPVPGGRMPAMAVESPARRESARTPEALAPVADSGGAGDRTRSAVAPPASASGSPPPARANAAGTAAVTPVLSHLELDEVVLLVPSSSGYDEVEVRVTLDGYELVVFDLEEERVVASVALSPTARGAAVTGPASIRHGSEYWFILPTSAGRIVLQLDDEQADAIAKAFEARVGTRVLRTRGEL